MARGTSGFPDVDERLPELSAKCYDLECVKTLVYFELLRGSLEAAVPRAEHSNCECPPIDHVLVFKILILQAKHSPSEVTLPPRFIQ